MKGAKYKTLPVWKSFSLMAFLLLLNACSSGGSADSSSSNSKTIGISIGTQDQVINTAVGGATVREKKLLKKHLPKDGKYENVQYKIRWSSYTSGPPITNKMLSGQIDIGLMGDFPTVINLLKFQQENEQTDSIYIGTLAYSENGAGNAIVVPKDSEATSIEKLQGKTVSVPFGSAAHGMLLRALKGAGLNPEKDVNLISQQPQVGGTSLRTGQVDAHADFVPFGELFAYRGFAKKIFDGAQTGVPTLHGIVVRSDFAKKYPEVVVGYLEAVIEANELYRQKPAKISADIEEWTGINKEVVYMFLGKSGLQQLNPTIGQTQITALKKSIETLKGLDKIEKEVNPDRVENWIDKTYLEKAMDNMETSRSEVIKTASTYEVGGKDALTGEAIDNSKIAAQLWVKGENKVINFASVSNMLNKLNDLKKEGKVASAMFVHDREKGWKLLADNAYYVDNGGKISAFLLKSDAEEFAESKNSQVSDFQALQTRYAEGGKTSNSVASKQL